MKDILIYLKKHLIMIIVALAVSFLIGFSTGYIRNNNLAYYEANFTVEEFDVSKLNDVDYLNSIKASADKYSSINVEKMLAHDGFKVIDNGNNNYTIITTYKYYETIFLKASKTLSTRAKTFIKDSIPNAQFENKNIIELKNYKSNYIFALYGILIGLVITLSCLLLLYYKKVDIKQEEYDNVKYFKNCFHREYWKIEKFTVKRITTLAMLFALMIACKFIPIPSGFGNLGLSFTYLFFSSVSMIYGPIVGFIIGIFSDVLGFIIKPDGVFYWGYMIQAALTGFIYGICFYKTHLSFKKVLLSRVLVNMLMNVILGSFLFAKISTDTEILSFMKAYILLVSLPKNLIYLLPQTLLLFSVLKLLKPIFKKAKLI